MEDEAFELIKLRGTIYSKIKKDKGKEVLEKNIKRYAVKAGDFLKSFQNLLSGAEIKIYDAKLRATQEDVMKYVEDYEELEMKPRNDYNAKFWKIEYTEYIDNKSRNYDVVWDVDQLTYHNPTDFVAPHRLTFFLLRSLHLRILT